MSISPQARRWLEQAAAGKGRTPTTAHPDCTCTVDATVFDTAGRGHKVRRVTPESRKACPQHGEGS